MKILMDAQHRLASILQDGSTLYPGSSCCNQPLVLDESSASKCSGCGKHFSLYADAEYRSHGYVLELEPTGVVGGASISEFIRYWTGKDVDVEVTWS